MNIALELKIELGHLPQSTMVIPKGEIDVYTAPKLRESLIGAVAFIATSATASPAAACASSERTTRM